MLVFDIETNGLAEECMHEVQHYYNVQCQLDAEGKQGKNWRDCH